jgi:hypothetical protein
LNTGVQGSAVGAARAGGLFALPGLLARGPAGGRLRWLIFMALALDLLGAVAILTLGPGAEAQSAWVQRGFPHDLVVLEHRGPALADVTLTLDGRYRLRLERLEPGTHGFELGREFRDDADRAPPSAYRPRALELGFEGERLAMPLEVRGGP